MGRKAIAWAVVLTAMLVTGSVAGAHAHKETLPEDALTLVQQASALLAQNPGMTGEVRERLQAALQSKRPEGVDLEKVAAALEALGRNDRAGARRLLVAATAPPRTPKPPQGVRRPASAAAGGAVTPAPRTAASPAPPSVETAMKMAEPLRTRFSGTPAEYGLLVVAAVLISLGVLTLRGTGEATGS